MDVWTWLLENPWLIVILCVALGFPIITAIWKAIKKKAGVQTYKDRGNKNAMHVRDMVEKYDKKKEKKDKNK